MKLKRIKIMKRVVFLIFFFSCLTVAKRCMAQLNKDDKSNWFGQWATDTNNLPLFVTNLEKHPLQWHPFTHMMSTGKVMVSVNQWGSVNLFRTSNRGMVNLTPSTTASRSGFYVMLQQGKKLYSLIYSELNANKKLEYGVGYTKFEGELIKDKIHLRVAYTICTPFDFSDGFYTNLEVTNLSKTPLEGKLRVRSDVWPKQNYGNFKEWIKDNTNILNKKGSTAFKKTNLYGDIFLLGNTRWSGASKGLSLELFQDISLAQNEQEHSNFFTGSGNGYESLSEKMQSFTKADFEALQASWIKVLQPVTFNLPEKWMTDECKWSFAQLLSFCFYDTSMGEYVINLGGYGLGEKASLPNGVFGIREMAETSMVLAYFNPELAKSSLRWMSKLQIVSGDMKPFHDYIKEDPYPADEVIIGGHLAESDSEIWFLLALGEYIATTKDYKFLQEQTNYLTAGKSGTIWEHAKSAFSFIKKYIKTGNHGLVRILNGDWNDYLSKIGQGEKGESTMNTGMLCRALLDIKAIAAAKGDTAFGGEVNTYYLALKKAADASFDQQWFIRGFDDKGQAIGSAEDRLFLDAQSWNVLGKCGSNDQRKLALQNTLKFNRSDIGLLLMSKPYSSPAPDISWAPIESGEGENAGIWPQTVYWTVWALAEAGMTEAAMEEWKKMSLHNHYKLHPQVPFGIFNGPDCYSSYYAGNREGWTQTSTFNRILEIPMNPMVAWQAFAMKKILIAKHRQADSY